MGPLLKLIFAIPLSKHVNEWNKHVKQIVEEKNDHCFFQGTFLRNKKRQVDEVSWLDTMNHGTRENISDAVVEPRSRVYTALGSRFTEGN